jgi:hypothetical protein
MSRTIPASRVTRLATRGLPRSPRDSTTHSASGGRIHNLTRRSTPPASVPDWTPGGFIILAAVCRVHQWDGIGEWWRITATPTYFNHQLIFSGLTWETSANAPGPNEIHFGGTLVHELGHWIRLVDLDCAAGATMCNASMSEQDTFDQFSLTQDDIDGANFNY